VRDAGSESAFWQVVSFGDGLYRLTNVLWPEFPSQLSFDRKAEAVGAVDALILDVPADGLGFFGVDGLHHQFPVGPPPPSITATPTAVVTRQAPRPARWL